MARPASWRRCERRSNATRRGCASGRTAVVAAVLGLVIDDYGPALDGFENDVIEVERDVFSDTHRQPVQRLYKLKREVRRMLVAIDSLDDPLARLIRVRGSRLHPEVLADLNEAEDQLDRAVTRAHSLSGLLDAALTASLTQITVRQNDDMRKISAWVAMAAVPTMVAGIYGMNFDHMPELAGRSGIRSSSRSPPSRSRCCIASSRSPAGCSGRRRCRSLDDIGGAAGDGLAECPLSTAGRHAGRRRRTGGRRARSELVACSSRRRR